VKGQFEIDTSDADHFEFQQAARKILDTPLLNNSVDPDGYRLVRRHLRRLRDWFELNTGWRLIDDSTVIRLNKQIVPLTPTACAIASHHSAHLGKADIPFTARRYVLFCLAAAALERSDAQTTLGRLADEIKVLAHQHHMPGVEFAFATRDERADLAAAVKLLVQLGAIRRVSGDEETYLQAAGDAVLYDVERRALARLLVAAQAPSRIAAGLMGDVPPIGELEQLLLPAAMAHTEDDRNRTIRRELTVHLLEDPVVYFSELPEEEAAYLTKQRSVLADRIANLTGLTPEIRSEGVAMADPEDRLTDVRMPESGTDGHAALLVAEQLAKQGSAETPIIREWVDGWSVEYRTYWRASIREPGATASLVQSVLHKLVALGLVAVNGHHVRALPAIQRFRFDAARLSAAPTGTSQIPAPAQLSLLSVYEEPLQ